MPLDAETNPENTAQAKEEIEMRADLKLIADMIAPGSRVLDIGCGDGALLDHLGLK